MADEWPPKAWTVVLDKLGDWSAWASGNPEELEGTSHRYGTTPHTDTGTGFRGLVTRVFRKFWGAAPSAQGPQVKLHVPLAADIARASADLLFAEPPAIKARKPDLADVPEGAEQPEEIQAALALAQRTQDRLDRYQEDGLVAALAEAAEVCAQLGGVFLRVTWTTDDRRVFLSRIDADAAFPEFRYGRLHRVTFWRDLSEPGDKPVWRHLEIHETAVTTAGSLPEGIIRHELHEGTADELGTARELTLHPETEALQVLIDFDGNAVRTHSPGLAVEYIPNARPSTIWRKLPYAANLGAADIAQCEDLLDQLDAAYSSLMRDLHLSRARITIPESWLETQVPGQGVRFDVDREVFVGLQQPPTADTKPELFQPAIRVEEHLRVMQQIVEDVLRRCGYSASTFGEDEDGQAATATEINARSGRSRLTRNRKLRHWQPAVERLLRKMLAVDLWLGRTYPGQGFAEDVDPDLVAVEFPAPAMSGVELAQMVALWGQAQAASIELRVRTLHPEWDDDAVKDEAAAIRAELGIAVESPEEFRPAGAEPPPPGAAEEEPEELPDDDVDAE